MNEKIRYSAVTTFNIQKHSFGVEMINSFFANWPDGVSLTAFIENSFGIDDKAVKPKILVKDFHQNVPEYNNFVQKFKDKEKYTDDFRFNVFVWRDNLAAI